MADEIKKEDVTVVPEKKKINPFLFVKLDELVNVKIIVVYDEKGSVMSVLNDDFFHLKDTLDVLKYNEYTFKFSSVNYEKINKYRQKCMEIDRIQNVQVVNNFKIRDFLIVYHLKEWDLKDENGNAIELKFDVNKALSDESIEIVYSLHPSIIDVVLTTLEKKLLLV